ncbi:MAG: glutamine-hydrolyzing GMP synthase [Bdellovibrionales bacterium RIFOXYC1_FULL_54_43]|nr:MAG: glutamine-hydrolyzing GMP synthase [Bdellovibrionales bacterium RIFOXYC1_FULL_54_43]OFZ82822.1 MAG: glutamine-hydrolyzing GMP synthase [Bdellovibrionales bacterium RIFOXYD1_FULL_55_31]
MGTHATIVILDYGSQYTQLITRRVRELGYFSRILPGDATLARIQELSPRAIVLSGGPSSVYDPGAPALPAGLLEYQRDSKIPLLGVCYGMQLVVREFGGQVKKAESREYGRMLIHASPGTRLFGAVPAKSFEVWMSHGDETRQMPEGFVASARSASGAIAAIENAGAGIYGLQFHPEVTHTSHGKELLRQFLSEIAGLAPDWNMGSVLEEQIAKIKREVGPDQHVICALSGGVDSAVAATLVHRAIGDRLHCVFVDHGLLRYRERERVVELFETKLHLPVECIDASREFLSRLDGISDPEKKRQIIGAEFIAVFERAAQSFARSIGHLPEFLVQGTLYPDVIESSPGHKHSMTIKSHHNVGGLPKELRFKLIEPLRELFKDEVRDLGRHLGVPEAFLKRHPFPGPGLAVRIIGPVTPTHLEILRQVDEVFINCLLEDELYDRIWQAFAVFLPVKSVGVQGDGRTHDHVVALRAVTSSDGMTADWYPFEPRFLAKVSSRICNEVKGVSRVVYDISSKPPATIEWE